MVRVYAEKRKNVLEVMHVFGLVEEGEAFSFSNQRDLCLWLFPEQLSGKSVCVLHDIAFNEMIRF